MNKRTAATKLPASPGVMVALGALSMLVDGCGTPPASDGSGGIVDDGDVDGNGDGDGSAAPTLQGLDAAKSMRDIVKCCGSGFDQAASFFSPSTNWTPRITSASSFEPLRARQCCSAH